MSKKILFLSAAIIISVSFFIRVNHGLAADASIATLGNQKILVLLINFLDSDPVPFTIDQASSMVFNGQVQKYFQEQSYNQISLSGDVYGWYTVQKNAPVNIPGQGVDCTGSVDSSDYEPMIINNGIDISKYDHLFIIMNGHFMTGCETAVGKFDHLINGHNYNISIGYISIDSTYNQPNVSLYNGATLPPAYSWSVFDSVLSHELGHALGLQHANGLDCGDQSFAGNCQNYEYGDPFDDMGMRGDALHFNAFYKELLGWIKPSSELVITQSGRYTINPLETLSGVKLAKIKLADGKTPFYLEYRRGVGFDSRLNEPIVSSNQNGLLVNAVNVPINGITYVNRSLLVDMSPTSAHWIVDTLNSSLNGASTFNVPAYDLTIGPIINNDANLITFDIRINSSTIQPTGSLSVTPSAKTVNSGETVTLNYTTHSNAITKKLYWHCPAGIKISWGAIEDICDTWQTLDNGSTYITVIITSAAPQAQNTVPNFYEYLSDKPNYAVGVASRVTVQPIPLIQRSILKDINTLSQKTQDTLTNFITYGVDANTVKLGAGERAAVINSYKAAFDKLPTTEAELADVIKIANGRWPSLTNSAAENQAKAQFLKIYKRAADINNANDNAAIKVMAYGLRQKAENRNLNSEVNGIKIFKAIYGRTPNSTEDWNIMQAITYSGASR